MTFENTISIHAPQEKVFDYLAHLENIPAWNYAISQVVQTSSGPVGVGTTFKEVRTLPRPSEETIRIIEFTRPSLLVLEGGFGPFRGKLSYTLTATNDGFTQMINTADLEATLLLLKPLGGLLSARIKSAVAQNLEVLKRLLESK